MASVEHIEKALERLVPTALSLRASQSIEEMLEEMAAADDALRPLPSAAPAPDRKRRGPWFGFGAAAAVAFGGLAALWFWPDRLEETQPGLAKGTPADDSMEVIREVSRVESAVDEGTLADDAGGMHRVLRYRVVGESFVRHGATGNVVRVVEPRDEMVLLPVTAF